MNGFTRPASDCPPSRAKPIVRASIAGPSAPSSGLPPSVFSICSADQFSAAFSVMKAISTMPPPITGTQPKGSAVPSFGLRKPSIRPSLSTVSTAQATPTAAIVPMTQSGAQPAPRITPVSTAPPA